MAKKWSAFILFFLMMLTFAARAEKAGVILPDFEVFSGVGTIAGGEMEVFNAEPAEFWEYAPVEFDTAADYLMLLSQQSWMFENLTDDWSDYSGIDDVEFFRLMHVDTQVHMYIVYGEDGSFSFFLPMEYSFTWGTHLSQMSQQPCVILWVNLLLK